MSLVEIRVEGAVSFLELNDPEKKNALDLPMAQSLLKAIRQVHHNPDCKVIVFTSKGRAYFSSGPDIQGLIDCAQDKQGIALLREITDLLNQIILEIHYSPKITIAAIHGYAYGGGFNIMLPCDVRFAESKTKFIENFYYMGVTPDLSSSYFLPRLIGLAKTKELILTGRLFTAKEAENWGLFYRVIDKRSEMMKEVKQFCQQILQGDSSTIPQMKELLTDADANSIEKHLKKEQKYLIDHLVKPETISRLKLIRQRSLIQDGVSSSSREESGSYPEDAS